MSGGEAARSGGARTESSAWHLSTGRALRVAVLLALVALSASTPAKLNGQVREEGALFILLPIGAQGVGLARAMTAVSGNGSAFWNPAGVAGIGATRAAIFRGDHIAGTVTGASILLSKGGAGVLGISYALLDSGTQDLTDDQGTVLGTISVRGHQGIVTAGIPLGSRIRLGGNLKWVQFRQSCRGQCPDIGVLATAYAADVGAQMEPFGGQPLTIGVMVAHLGSPLRIRGSNQSNPLPLRLRVGAAYLFSWDLAEEEIRLRLLTEVEERPRDPGDPSLFVGSEFEAGSEDRVYVRGGYIFGSGSQVDGAGVGFGIRYENFQFDIARSLARGGPALEREPMHFTLGFTL